MDKTLWCTNRNRPFFYAPGSRTKCFDCFFVLQKTVYIYLFDDKKKDLKLFSLRPAAQKNISVNESHTIWIPVNVLS